MRYLMQNRRGSGKWLGMALVSAGLLCAAPPALAALQSGDFQTRGQSQFLPSSPVIARVQALLKGFDLYDGLVDGRMNDEFDAAVRHYQTISGLAPDGRVSEELLAHIEFKGQAQRLLARLEDVSKTQRKLAREQLRQSSATRGLVDQRPQKVVADPTRNPDVCYDAPTVACLITEAIETTKSVHRRHFRDWVYGEIAVVQARARMPEAARRSAGQIEDPRLIIKTLRNIAQAQAETNQLEAAAVSVGIVPDPWSRVEALATLAHARAQAGDWPAARLLTADIRKILDETGDDQPKTALLGELADGLARAGDAASAMSLLDQESARVHGSSAAGDAEGHIYRLSTLSAAYSAIDQPGAARSHLPDASHAVQRRTALIALARAEARAGQDAAAAEVASALTEARYRAVAFSDIARIQMAAGRHDAARRSLTRADASTAEIDPTRKFARAHAIDRMALAWLSGGLLAQSEKSADRIADAKLRAVALGRIGQAYFGRGEAAQARRLFARMEDAADEITAALDRVWMYANVSLYFVAQGNSTAAVQTFDRGLAVARKMSSSWARAQALVRLVSALGGLTKAGISPSSRQK